MDASHSINIDPPAAYELVSGFGQEDTVTGKNGDECSSVSDVDVYNVAKQGMDLIVFKAAKGGDIDALQEHRGNLDQMLTPTKNTVLHIYIACLTEKEQESTKTGKMLETCQSLLLQPNENGDTPLHTAARFGRAGIVELLIAKVASENGLEEQWKQLIRTTNKEGDTALHQAVRFNHLDVVKILTTQDPECSYAVNDAGETPLYLAAERGYGDLGFQILPTCTSSPDFQGPNGRTALHAAVICNHQEMTRKLLEKRRELTKAVDEQGCTPLHLAASFGHTSIVKQLLEHDRSAAYVGDKDQKMTALHFAASKGHADVMKELITQCPDCCELVDHKRRNILHCAIDAGNISLVEDLVLQDPWLSNVLLNGKDDKGDTPLHRLATCNSIQSYSSSLLGTDARVDKMAFNEENRNAFDILLQDNTQFYSSSTRRALGGENSVPNARQKDNLKMNGVMLGCRIVSDKDVNNIEGDKGDQGGKGEKGNKGDKGNKEVEDIHMVVATLIATVSFAAGFTMPGGYQGDKGPDQGFAILTKSAAFQTFVITNTIAMTLSSCSVLMQLYWSGYKIKGKIITKFEEFTFVYLCTMLALIAMVIAFITGTYAVLGYSSGLGIVVLVLGIILFFVLTEILIYLEKENLGGPQLLPLSISLFVVLQMIEKLFHKCNDAKCLTCRKRKVARIRTLDKSASSL